MSYTTNSHNSWEYRFQRSFIKCIRYNYILHVCKNRYSIRNFDELKYFQENPYETFNSVNICSCVGSAQPADVPRRFKCCGIHLSFHLNRFGFTATRKQNLSFFV